MTPPPWKVNYDRFRHLYPTGGLILDLVATPTPHCPHYVVKATAQVGNLTLLSVLGEALQVLEAETQACQKLFQVLSLTGTEDFPASPPLQSQPIQSQPIQSQPIQIPPVQNPPVQSVPVYPPPVSKISPDSPPNSPQATPFPTVPVTSPSEIPLTHPIAPASPPEPSVLSDRTLKPSRSTPDDRSLKAEPYGMTQPIEREGIMATEVDDWSEELAQIEAEVKRLGWTPQQESNYLQGRYGKLSRDHITDYGELLQFLTDLQGQPSPQRGSEPWSPEVIPAQRYPSPPSLTTEQPVAVPPISRQDLMDQVLAEIHRIGWTARQGSEYLQQTYQVKTRQELTHAQLQEFILYLQHHP